MHAIVHYHRSCGVTGYRRNESRERVLRLLETQDPAVRPDHLAAPLSVEQETGAVDKIPVVPRETAVDLQYLNAEIAGCRRCPLHHERRLDTPGSGALRPQLLVIGEWLCVPPSQEVPAGTLFGVEEDRMLARMTAAIGLTAADVFVTNIIKCAVPDTVRPSGEHAVVCAAYLKRQIELLAPAAICAMGTMAAQTLTGDGRPLSMLRGRAASYQPMVGPALPLVSTYHPTFLLQNAEMKQAAWADLQLVARLLRQQHR
ncbi:MAG: uracil-DNA glycosylase [Desulfofustis sp.]|nr:uracil-DNA glycosylase [Desulfofustis sp.]